MDNTTLLMDQRPQPPSMASSTMSSATAACVEALVGGVVMELFGGVPPCGLLEE
jgi:hypothetical protein